MIQRDTREVARARRAKKRAEARQKYAALERQLNETHEEEKQRSLRFALLVLHLKTPTIHS